MNVSSVFLVSEQSNSNYTFQIREALFCKSLRVYVSHGNLYISSVVENKLRLEEFLYGYSKAGVLVLSDGCSWAKQTPASVHVGFNEPNAGSSARRPTRGYARRLPAALLPPPTCGGCSRTYTRAGAARQTHRLRCIWRCMVSHCLYQLF